MKSLFLIIVLELMKEKSPDFSNSTCGVQPFSGREEKSCGRGLFVPKNYTNFETTNFL
jgi:hypothetical protein